ITLGALVALLLCGQLFAADLGNDVTDLTDDSCPKPPEIANGHVNHMVRYQCNTYYRLRTEGDGVYTLNSEKQWINKDIGEKLPECEAGVCWG
uniref:Sushi domain-containing protein n=1 Tax=Spermophilus dauricus TaxID=99837 RepID=A0A8C9QMD0_SPEDA